MTDQPLATVQLHHATLELWPGHVRTIFSADGAEVPAAPNGGETVVNTALHEHLHHAIAQATADEASHCLRAVADGDGRCWTDERRQEEVLAYSLTHLLRPMVAALVEAYGEAAVREGVAR